MILAFTGKLKSGKDTAGERMVELVDLPSRRVSFAAPLKESAAALLDIDAIDWETYKNDPEVKILLTTGYNESPLLIMDSETLNMTEIEEPNVIREFTAREFLQRYGTEAHRGIFGDDFWVEQAIKSLARSTEEFVYVTDARFNNEADAVIRCGGLIIQVLGEDVDTGSHASEAGLPDDYITFVIDNSTRDDGYANLDAQLRSIALNVGLPLRDLAAV